MTGNVRRTWPQRLTLTAVIIAAVTCFAAAGAFATGQWVLSQRQLVELAEPTTEAQSGGSPQVILPGATTTTIDPEPPDPDEPADSTTTTTILLAEPDAANFLITGADNGDCDGDDTATVGDREDLGERSDTIMVWRVNPESNQLAILSFPRDLYVDMPGGSKAKINSAYRRNDPDRLIETINLNFGVPVDHYVQLDFCAFKRLVDAVGGVEVPFDAPSRDTGSGLDITTSGCVNLDGDMALSYVRSRHFEYEDPAGSGEWTEDPTSDFGRIARQQDFLRRTVAKIIDDGLYDPNVAGALIETNSDYLVTDNGLTLRKELEFANTLRKLDPSTITTYRIESSTSNASGQSIEIPRVNGDNMQAILSVFRGEATLADAPDQVFETTATTDATTTTSTTSAPFGVSTTTVLPTVEVEENVVGVAPDREDTC